MPGLPPHLAHEESFTAPRATPWRKPAGLPALLADWADDPRVARNLTLDERVSGRDADYVPLPEEIAPAIQAALAARGMRKLYRHQRDAFALAQAGRDLVIATPTASGKSLCYNLPVLQALSGDPGARALYLFPTKALSRGPAAAEAAEVGAPGGGGGGAPAAGGGAAGGWGVG